LLQQAFLPSELVIDSDHVVEEGDPIGSSGVEGHQASDHPLAGQNERGHVHGKGEFKYSIRRQIILLFA